MNKKIIQCCKGQLYKFIKIRNFDYKNNVALL